MSLEELVQDIRSGMYDYPPLTADHAAAAEFGLSLEAQDEFDAFYIFACANLLNAYVKESRLGGEYSGRYAFKNRVADAIERVVMKQISGVAVYYTPAVCYITIAGVQFGFHKVPLTVCLDRYQSSPANKPQEWSGIRLQPAAALIMALAKEVRKVRSFQVCLKE